MFFARLATPLLPFLLATPPSFRSSRPPTTVTDDQASKVVSAPVASSVNSNKVSQINGNNVAVPIDSPGSLANLTSNDNNNNASTTSTYATESTNASTNTTASIDATTSTNTTAFTNATTFSDKTSSDDAASDNATTKFSNFSTSISSAGVPTQSRYVSPIKSTTATITSVNSTTERIKLRLESEPNIQTPQDLSMQLRLLFTDLEAPGPFYKDMSPTLRFSYVPPPKVIPTGGIKGSNNYTSDFVVSNWRHPINVTSLYDNENDSKKPIAIYLPGLDGLGISAAINQFDDLARTFEFWRLTVLPDDKSSFQQVTTAIIDFVKEISLDENNKDGKNNTRPVVLIGESSGGMLAPAVAIQMQKSGYGHILKGLTLVNPATSLDQTYWENLLPTLTSIMELLDDPNSIRKDRLSPYAIFGSLIIATISLDINQFFRLFQAVFTLPSIDVPPRSFQQILSLLDGAFDAFRAVEQNLPSDVLNHRVSEWLSVGGQVVNKRWHELRNLPIFVVAGTQDIMLPSKNEAERITKEIEKYKNVSNCTCETLLIDGRGHYVLDTNVNLTEAIVFSNIDPLNWKTTKPKYDPITDWTRPSPERTRDVIERSIALPRQVHSPVFFSTDEQGKRWRGLSKFPKITDTGDIGPLLIVGNHQFAVIDIPLLVSEMVEKLDLCPRGLTHPTAFINSPVNELYGRTPGVLEDTTTSIIGRSPIAALTYFQEFGSVPVSPRNFYRLMQTGQPTVLYPGGSREALTNRRDYPLFWPEDDDETSDFIRVAARFNATIIPLSSIGMIDSFLRVFEPEEIFRIPFLGDRAKEFSESLPSARYDQNDEDELLFPPLSIPSIPRRNYFLFGRPISTRDVDPKDPVDCKRMYNQVKRAVRDGLDDLLAARKRDPYDNTIRRFIYERVYKKQAPTFEIDLLNKPRKRWP